MNPGKLRDRIAILKKQVITDTSGYSQETWLTIAETWAMVEGLKGREYFTAAAVSAEKKIKITIRYRSDIKSDMRIKHDNLYYEIKSIVDLDGRKRYLQLICEVIVSG